MKAPREPPVVDMRRTAAAQREPQVPNLTIAKIELAMHEAIAKSVRETAPCRGMRATPVSATKQ